MTSEMIKSPSQKGHEEYLFLRNRLKETPVKHRFSKEDIDKLNKRELNDYEQRVRMNDTERDALRRWVSSGHSVHEHPGSRYVCLYGACPPPDFLDVYRMDQAFDAALKDKTDAEKRTYLMNYFGWDDDESTETKEQEEMRSAYSQTPPVVLKRIRTLKRELFYLWMFLSSEGLYEEAREYVEDNKDEEVPFEEEW